MGGNSIKKFFKYFYAVADPYTGNTRQFGRLFYYLLFSINVFFTFPAKKGKIIE